MTFRVGQKVVCVDDKPLGNEGYRAHGIYEGSVYTIRHIELCPVKNQTGVLLVEIINPTHLILGGECLFRASRFRPVVERKTSIEIFHQIRRDVENNVPANAECA